MRILVFCLAFLFLVAIFPSTVSASIPQLTRMLFNGGVSPETAQALDLSGTNLTYVNLTKSISNSYTALVDVTVSTDGTQVTRHLAINFKLQSTTTPTPTSSATATPQPSSRTSPQPDLTPIPTPGTPSPSPSRLPSPTSTPFDEQESLSESEPGLPDENLNVPSPVPSQPEIRIILFGNQPLDPSGQGLLAVHLNGQPGQQSAVLLPVSLSYSQGPTKNFAIQFNYSESSGVTTTRRVSTAGGSSNTGTRNTLKYDLNSDKIINSLDVEIFFNEWRNKLRGGSMLRGDFNADRVINSIDYAMLKNQMGKRV